MSVAPPQSVSTSNQCLSEKAENAPDCSGASGWYPPPGTSPNLKSGLLQRAVAGARLRADVVADHARLVAIEVPLTGLRVLRVALHREGRCRTGARGSAGDD